MSNCTLPPTGWKCNLENGHDGACPTHVDYEPLAANVYVRFKKSTRQQIKEISKKERVPESTVIRRLVETHPDITAQSKESTKSE